MIPSVGWFEMVIIFVVVLIIFGPKSLPKIGQALGRGIREFKDAARGLTEMDDDPPSKPVAPKQQVPDSTTHTAQSSSTTTEKTATENHV